MAENANQHYVPQFYFRYFSDNGRSINVILKDAGNTVPNASIKGQASKRYFYGDSSAEERMKRLDGLYASTFNIVMNADRIADIAADTWSAFLQNIMLQRARTLSARIVSQPMMDRLLQLHAEIEINKDESLSDELKDSFRGFAQSLEADPKQSQLSMMYVALEVAHGLSDLVPVFLHNKTCRPFIFSDAPVVFTNPHCKNIQHQGVLGVSTPGLMVLFPLGPGLQLLLLDGEVYDLKRAQNSRVIIKDLRDVREINKLQIHSAVNAVYFSDIQYAAYVQDLWSQEKNDFVEHLGPVNEAPGFNQDNEPIGDILHSYEPQLPFFPTLSFLRYVEVEERDYRFRRRGE